MWQFIKNLFKGNISYQKRIEELNNLMCELFEGGHIDTKAGLDIMKLVKSWKFKEDDR